MIFSYRWKESLLILMFFSVMWPLIGQHQDLQEKPKIWQGDDKKSTDSTSILSAFKNGKVNGHFRYYFSNTVNEGDLTDYYAQAIGGGLRYETGSFYGFHIGVSGFYIFNAGSSDLAERDPLTQQLNRYELGLFDVTTPDQLNEINRLEELFIKYQNRKTVLTLGRQLLNNPFINLQDGRMRPTAVEGLWAEHQLNKKSFLQGGWIWGVGPRSTSRWYDAGESIGIYPRGVDVQGQPARYFGNTETQGVGILNYQHTFSKEWKLDIWNMWMENIQNTTLLQVGYQKKIKNRQIYAGTQFWYQQKTGDGGNQNADLAYNQNDNPVYVTGVQVGMKVGQWNHSVNFNRIYATGRFLMPREWGRDNFYTFIPRERNEGFGDVTAISWRTVYKSSSPWTTSLAAGYFDLPDVRNFELNKYGLPSYIHTNLDVRYKFDGLLNGFEAQTLFSYKRAVGETYDNPRYIIHKVNMFLINVVVNYRF